MCSVTLVGCDSATPRTASLQAPLSMGFSRQESWSRLPCWPPGNPCNPEIEPKFLTPPALAGGFFITSTTWEAHPGETDLQQECTRWPWAWTESNTRATHSAASRAHGEKGSRHGRSHGLLRPRGARQPPATGPQLQGHRGAPARTGPTTALAPEPETVAPAVTSLTSPAHSAEPFRVRESPLPPHGFPSKLSTADAALSFARGSAKSQT